LLPHELLIGLLAVRLLPSFFCTISRRLVADIKLRVNIVLVPFAADLLKELSRGCRENVVEIVLPLIA